MNSPELGDLPDNQPHISELVEQLGDQLLAVLDNSPLHRVLKEYYAPFLDEDEVSELIRKIAISHLED